MYFKDCLVKKPLTSNSLANLSKFNPFDILLSHSKTSEDILNTTTLTTACATSNGGSPRIDLDEIKACDMSSCVKKPTGI